MEDKTQNKLSKIILAIVQPEEVIAGKHLTPLVLMSSWLVSGLRV